MTYDKSRFLSNVPLLETMNEKFIQHFYAEFNSLQDLFCTFFRNVYNQRMYVEKT